MKKAFISLLGITLTFSILTNKLDGKTVRKTKEEKIVEVLEEIKKQDIAKDILDLGKKRRKKIFNKIKKLLEQEKDAIKSKKEKKK